MKINILSKSSFIRGLQCHKSLYLYKNRYFLRDKTPPEQQAKFKRGTDVGKLARKLFPGGIDVSPPTPFQYAKAVDQTKRLIAEQIHVIYEASFSFKGVLAALDILVFRDGKWFGYEVKSSLSISETYLNDAALQYYVITGCGIELADISIIYINKDYVLHGELILNQLFVTQSVLEETISRQAMVSKEIEAQLKVVELSKSPAVNIGLQCNKPYPCDFQGHCWKHIPGNSIFELQWLSEDKKFELYSKNILLPADIPGDFLPDPTLKLKVQAHKTSTPIVDDGFLSRFAQNTRHPLCFLKVWYHRPAVPFVAGTKPYETLPFFAGFGFMENQETEISYSHIFFEPETDPKELFHETICRILNTGSMIISFNDPSGDWYRQLIANILPGADHESYFDLHEFFNENKLYFPSTNGNVDLLYLSGKLLSGFSVGSGIYKTEYEAIIDYPEKSATPKARKNYFEKMESTSIQYLLAIQNLLKFITRLR